MDTVEHTIAPSRGKALALLILLVAVAGYGAYSYYFGAPHGQQVKTSVDVLEVRLQNLENSIMLHEKRLAKLEEDTQKLMTANPAAAPGAPGVAAAPSADEDKRIAALEKEIGTLKAEKPMENRGQLASAIRLLSSFHRFSDKVLAGKPFAAELPEFQQLVAGNEVIGKFLSALSPFAENGIPTFAQLLASFDQAEDQLNSAEAVPPADAGWWDRLFYNLRHLVSVRRIDDTDTGTSTEAIVSRAAAHLEREEVEEAYAEIKSLSPAARGNFSEWTEEAQAYLAAPALMDQIEEQVMQTAFGTPSAEATQAAPAAKAQEP